MSMTFTWDTLGLNYITSEHLGYFKNNKYHNIKALNDNYFHIWNNQKKHSHFSDLIM